jgi:hypothetical protein
VDDLDEPSQELKSRLWDEITARDGSAAIEDLCADLDRDEVAKALDSLVQEHRVMKDKDGIVYTLD